MRIVKHGRCRYSEYLQWLLYLREKCRISSYNGHHFPAFGLSNSEYGHFFRPYISKLNGSRRCFGENLKVYSQKHHRKAFRSRLQDLALKAVKRFYLAKR